MSVGENIYRLRKEMGMSQEELAERLFVSRQTISLWEKDQTVPTIDNLIRLKEVFNVSVDKILSDREEREMHINSRSLDTICAALAYAMGIKPPKYAAPMNPELANYVDKALDGKKADRIVMYNPDAIAQWIYEKYPEYLADVKSRTAVEIYLGTVMPSVTPVCFGTMYTGAQPSVHGIQKYEKPVIAIESIFDSLIAAGKKPAIVSYGNASLSRIFLEKNMDYYIMKDIAGTNAKAMELILRDEHDFIVIYNGNFDSVMHKNGPENPRTLSELRANGHAFSVISELIKSNWKHHNTLLGFAMDHGCHEIDGPCGSHGLDMPEDLNIVHMYKAYAKEID